MSSNLDPSVRKDKSLNFTPNSLANQLRDLIRSIVIKKLANITSFPKESFIRYYSQNSIFKAFPNYDNKIHKISKWLIKLQTNIKNIEKIITMNIH